MSLAIGSKSKPTRHHFISTNMAINKKKQNKTLMLMGMRRILIESSHISGRNLTWYRCLGSLAFLQKLKYRIILISSSFTLKCLHKEIKDIFEQKIEHKCS